MSARITVPQMGAKQTFLAPKLFSGRQMGAETRLYAPKLFIVQLGAEQRFLAPKLFSGRQTGAETRLYAPKLPCLICTPKVGHRLQLNEKE